MEPVQTERSTTDPVPIVAPSIDYGTPGQTASTLDLASMILKLLGIYLLTQGIPYLVAIPMRLFSFSVSREIGMLASMLMPGLTITVMGSLLLFRTQWFTSLLWRTHGDLAPERSPAGVELQAAAFAVVGVIFVASNVGGVVSFIASHLIATSRANTGMIEARHDYTPVIEPFIEMVLGILLFLRARGLAVFWRYVRREVRG